MKRPRVVVDTNVLVSSGIKFSGAEAAVLNVIADRRVELAVSQPILDEYRKVLIRPKLRLDPRRVTFTLLLVKSEGVLFAPLVKLSVSPDESDNRFLECAEAADADYLVTGNKRHFPARWKRTDVVNARELHARLGTE